MKLLIVTLVALSVGLSECFDSLHPPRASGYNSDEALLAFFNIKADEVNADCKTEDDKKKRWDDIGKSLDVLGKAAVAGTAFDNDYQAPRNVINVALPNAKQDQKDQKLKFYKKLPNPDKPPKQ